MKTREKVTMLRDALLVVTTTKATAAWLTQFDPKALEQAQKALDATATRQSQTPEQKAIARSQRRFEKRRNRLVAWLKSDGIVNGATLVNLKTGQTVKAITDPVVGPEGATINVVMLDGTKHMVSVLEYRPDFSVLAKEALKKAPTPAGTPAVRPPKTQAARKAS